MLAELDERGEWHDVTCVVDDDFAMVTLRKPRSNGWGNGCAPGAGCRCTSCEPPMHSPPSTGCGAERRRRSSAGLDFRDPVVPVVADHDGALLTTGDQVRTMLLDGCVRPVDWPATLASLRDKGVGRLCVAGQDALFSRVPVAARNFEIVKADPRRAMRPRRRAAAA